MISIFIIHYSANIVFAHGLVQIKNKSYTNLDSPILFAQTQQQENNYTPTPSTQQKTQEKGANFDSGIIKFIIFLIYAGIIAFTCYKKHKRELIIFSSYTDVAITFTLFALIIIFSFLITGQKTILLTIVIVIVGLLIISTFIIYVISTFKYNTKIIYSILAAFTKISVSILFILLLIGASAKRRRLDGERRDVYERRVRRESAAKVAVIMGLYTTFVYFSTTEKSFIPLKKYIKGIY
jgi:sensor histidine kinase YesM